MKKEKMLFPILMLVLITPVSLKLWITISASSNGNQFSRSTQTPDPDFTSLDVFGVKSHHELQKADSETHLKQYVSHDPIIIEENIDFAVLGFSGNGSPENPYVIEGLQISGGAEYLIHISKTTMHFQVRNNYLNGMGMNGIRLSTIVNGIVESNIVTNCSKGIQVRSSEHITISNNSLFNNRFGIYIGSRANKNTISHNTLYNNGHSGIFVESASQNTLILNTTYNNSRGISIEFAEQNTIINNNATSNNDAGIRLFKSKNNIVTNNTVSQNTFGILLGWWGAEYNTISHNIVFNNTGAGIFLYESGQNTLIGNILTNNGINISGREVDDYLQATVTDNLINNQPLVFWQQVQGGTVPSDAGQVILIETTGVEVTGQNLSRSSIGIFAFSSSDLNIHHNFISSCQTGIFLESSEQNTLSHNTLVNNTEGIFLSQSKQNTLTENSLVNNGLVISGYPVEEVLQSTVTDNLVNNRPLVFWQQVQGGTIPPDAGQVILIETTGVEVTGQNLSRSSIGVLAVFGSNLTIHHNIISHCRTGIYLRNSGQNTLSHNILSHNSQGGIRLAGFYGSNNTVFNNTISQNRRRGIYLDHSQNNIISNNSISQNIGHGIFYIQADNNTVSYNIISQNTDDGINIDSSNYNTVTYNTIFQNHNDGIYLQIFGHHVIAHNIIGYNTHNGINLKGSENNNIIDNIVVGNFEYGIILSDTSCIERCGSDSNTVDKNIFIENNIGGSSQASDSSLNNTFSSNYWDDHDNTDQNADEIADTPYSIAGSINNQDVVSKAFIPPFVLPDIIPPPPKTTTSIITETNTPIFPEISEFIVCFILIMVILLFRCQKRNRHRKNET